MVSTLPISGELREDTRGAVYVEFLIAFLPVYVFFLCLIQLGLIFSVRLAVEHAATQTVRAAAVVIGDNPTKDRSYSNEKAMNTMDTNGERYKVIKNAALLTLAPMVLSGMVSSVDVIFPEPDKEDGPARTGKLTFSPINGTNISKVRVRIEVDALCRISFANLMACPSWLTRLGGSTVSSFWLPTKRVRAEAIFPYQGARYAYKPEN